MNARGQWHADTVKACEHHGCEALGQAWFDAQAAEQSKLRFEPPLARAKARPPGRAVLRLRRHGERVA